MWQAEFYEDKNGHKPCEKWMEEKLGDVQHDALVTAIELVLEPKGLDVCETEWGKPLSDGLYEFRVRHTAAEISHMFAGSAAEGTDTGEDVLLRVFFTTDAGRIILLLAGYDKGEDASEKRQQREITAARKLLKDFKDRRAAARRAVKKAGGGKKAAPSKRGNRPRR